MRPADSDPIPHPAEDLSSDDDLLSWILVDQLGCLPNTKLGVHPQQVKFVGAAFETREVLEIVQDVGGRACPLQYHYLVFSFVFYTHCTPSCSPLSLLLPSLFSL